MKHLAIIADGNRRWANEHGLPNKIGYIQGLTTIENCCDWAISRGVKYLTVFCFSTENWGRPQDEVDLLMDLSRWYFGDRREWYVNRGIRVRFSGRRDRFDHEFIDLMHRMEVATTNGQYLTLTICVDYGGRDEIARAIAAGAKTEKEITAYLTKYAPEPDMVLRTGGDVRLSNFILWQSAYAELMFINTLFPDLSEDKLDDVMHEYRNRKRNYGC